MQSVLRIAVFSFTSLWLCAGSSAAGDWPVYRHDNGRSGATPEPIAAKSLKLASNPAKATSWKRLRPDCWLSTIPAAGMVLSPEGGGGCSCGGWSETSVGFMPKRSAGRAPAAENQE